MNRWIVALAGLTLIGCQPRSEGLPRLDAARSGAIADSVRAFADSIALGVTARGPAAWRDYFSDGPEFFMASEGRLVFPNSDVAERAIQELVGQISSIELSWGDSLRVDPLAPGLAVIAAPYHEVRVDPAGDGVMEDGYFTGVAEHGPTGWRLRDAHWSVTPAADGP